MKCEEPSRFEKRYRDFERKIVQKSGTTAAACKEGEDEPVKTREHAEGHNEATATADRHGEGRDEATAAAVKVGMKQQQQQQKVVGQERYSEVAEQQKLHK